MRTHPANLDTTPSRAPETALGTPFAGAYPTTTRTGAA
jgi:hypothetical protein